MGFVPPNVVLLRLRPPGWNTLACGKCAQAIDNHDISCSHCGYRLTSGPPLKFGGYDSRDMPPEEIEQEPTTWEQASNLVIDIHRMRSEAEQNITFIEQELAACRTRINRKLDIDTYR